MLPDSSHSAPAQAPAEGLTARIIRACIANRFLVLLLSALLIGAGVWSAQHVTVDAIPDLSDVQVVIRTDYAGQAPQIVQDQVTYPLTTAMLAVPQAKVVRGYSMFGTSFVYLIFEDGTDLYWARSRVLEQLSTLGGRLPAGVNPQLGPDATAVGWVFQYVLTTGPYSAAHPGGLWRPADTDPFAGATPWFADPADAPPGVALTHHRHFPAPATTWVDPQTERRYPAPDAAPKRVRPRLVETVVTQGFTACPLTGQPLAPPQADLSDLRGKQDWYLRPELTAVDGVSEVAAIGGFTKQYQVTVDPNRLRAYGLPLSRVRTAVARANADVGGRLLERSENEFMVRGLGYLGRLTDADLDAARNAGGHDLENVRSRQVLEDLGRVALGANAQGVPVYLRDVAEVSVGSDIRRAAAEWNGRGEVTGGVVVMRFGENARDTIARVRTRLQELEAGLPPGVAVEVAYDRSDLIERAVHTVADTLKEEIFVVGGVIFLFLLHARSAFVAALVLPAGVLVTLTVMYALGLNANIMSLGGIAISIGVMVDSSIVMVENAHKHFEQEKQRRRRGEAPRPQTAVIADAAAEVGPTLFFSLLIITVSFLPIFVLGEQSGRLFKPLAWTKTIAMAGAAVLAVTLIPVVMVYLIREDGLRKRVALGAAAALGLLIYFLPLGAAEAYRLPVAAGAAVVTLLLLPRQRIHDEDTHPLSRLLRAVYNPFFALVMRFKVLTLLLALALFATTAIPYSRLGTEFMPPLEEGDLLYMPVTDPGISLPKAAEILQQTDALIAQFPEVDNVFGKIGRADTATDPAPISMLETTITLQRDKTRWRHRPVERFYSGWPTWLAWLPSKAFPSTRAITTDELVYGYELPGLTGPDGAAFHAPGLNDALQLPGMANAWTSPIRTRIDMLSTGIRTPVGIKIMGEDLTELARLSEHVANLLRTDARTSVHLASAFADKSVGGNYFDLQINRDAIARHNLSVGDVQDVVMTAMGGMNVTQTVEGLERYPVNVRYPRELRDSADELDQVLVATPAGAQIPLGQLTTRRVHKGPPMIKSENARLTSWVYVDIKQIDVGTFVENARAVIAERLELPPGYTLLWSGQYAYIQSAREKLQIAVPLAGVAILLLLYAATRSWLRVGIVLLAVPFSLIGAAWTVYLLDYNLSLAVWVGVIALAGLDAETGLVMLLYLDQSYEDAKRKGKLKTAQDLWHAVHHGAVQRIRPKSMTVMTTMIGLLPLLWATGAGADTMRRLAAPMIGGLATSFVAELLLYPVIFYIAKQWAMRPGVSDPLAD